ncbi:uncharacterized protein LOC119641746 [Glossina fuscipes]|uniref:Uncharacterized protein LOC119641746 n=1 Tax=Glossina fuscipes TaxID=7396 RepID=A0A9C6DYC6_9MUSC|nr:uncharacterized protein LOC119641746 [Glossina fuscipes]KAI9588932.1 hypothetical protein GQX74_007101 [Glossina fuscipes]
MLSFFSKKKHNAETPPEDIIQGPAVSQEQNADDFIFIERRSDEDPSRSQRNVYPPMPPVFGTKINHLYPRVNGNTTIGQASVPYVQDVPFVLAPQLCNKTTLDLTQTQVDGILALLTRQMSVGEQEEYNFALERSIQNECY